MIKNKQLNMNKDFYSVKELADLLHLSRITIFNRIKNGKIEAEKVGRNYIIKKKDVDLIILDGLTDKVKSEIEKGVKRVIAEYGDVLKKLGKE